MWTNMHRCVFLNSAPSWLSELQKKSFTFTVRDSLVNICPLRDFAYGLRSNAAPAATGLSKQSNYELVRGLGILFIPGIVYRFLKSLLGFAFKFWMPLAFLFNFLFRWHALGMGKMEVYLCYISRFDLSLLQRFVLCILVYQHLKVALIGSCLQKMVCNQECYHSQVASSEIFICRLFVSGGATRVFWDLDCISQGRERWCNRVRFWY